LRELYDYYDNQGPFTPNEELAKSGASQECREFIQALMARDPKHRPSADQASKHNWITLNRLPSPGTPFEAV
jgi:serine/threonine protein kinase